MNIGASYSTLCQRELLDKLIPQYAIEHAESCVFLQRGVNDTYQVRCADTLYSLRVYRHGLRSREAIEFELAALNYLNDQGAKVAYPIERRDGGFVTELHAPEGLRFAIVTTHAKGREPDYDIADNGKLFGASVAELHELSDGFETEYQRPGLVIDVLLDKSLDIILPACRGKPEVQAFLRDTAATLHSAVDSVPLTNQDTGFCHGDCHGCNVHDNNGSLTHFDFDCCGFGHRVFELATFKWGIRGDDNEAELWTMFLQGYNSRRVVSADDLSLIDAYVVIRQIWWMALIMGNARDFGHQATSDEFIEHNMDRIKKFMTR